MALALLFLAAKHIPRDRENVLFHFEKLSDVVRTRVGEDKLKKHRLFQRQVSPLLTPWLTLLY